MLYLLRVLKMRNVISILSQLCSEQHVLKIPCGPPVQSSLSTQSWQPLMVLLSLQFGLPRALWSHDMKSSLGRGQLSLRNVHSRSPTLFLHSLKVLFF